MLRDIRETGSSLAPERAPRGRSTEGVRRNECEYCPARMDFAVPAELTEIRSAVRELCSRFPGEYWRELEPDRYPEEFVAALTEHGWLAALIPKEYGGVGLGLPAASVILEEINASGCNAAVCHAQMYIMGTLLRHGSDEQKQRFLPAIASGELRLQAFGITEPTVGSDTTQIQTRAERVAGGYVIRGQKIWTSRALHSDLMLLLARTTPLDEVEKRTGGLSVFVVDMKAAAGTLEIRPIKTMMNHATTEVFFDGVEIPEDALVGEEGRGFGYILDAMNAERILIAAECIGDGRWFVDQAARYASDRVVFGRPIGANQGVQFPIARAHAAIEAADLVRYKAAWLFEHGEPCGPEANMAKLLASEASWQAANACLDTHGGYGFAAEYDVERKFRETRLYSIAPISNNLVLAYLGQHVLGMPRSY
jgi:acyl-CoA dehydrogenase